jgi:membrane protein DedA with SNARE-associated domain
MGLEELDHIIREYGYVAIFLFVFLQEIGVPNPLTNELVLLFSGYLAYLGVLNTLKVFFVAVSADFIGTSILYFIFYLVSRQYIFKCPPRVLTKFIRKLKKLKQRINNRNVWTIFLGRLTPFLRGYISVAAGILQIKPRAFLTTVLLSAITWSGGLVLVGKTLGPYWNEVIQKIGIVQFIMLLAILIVISAFAGKYITRKEFSKD